jgi:hypothetical protein
MRTIALVLLFLFIPRVLGAQGLSLPQWEVKKIEDVEYACYGLEDAKILVKIDLELRYRGQKLTSCELDKASLSETLDRIMNAASEQVDSTKALQDLLGKKNLEIVNLEKQNTDLSKKTIRNNLSWIISSGLMIAVVAFTSGWLLRAKG